MRRDGFSLIEISIVLVIVATILTSVLPAITEGTKIKATEVTTEHMEAIQDAIQAYYSTNAVLPCPADLSLAVNVTNFGRRAANANCNGGAPDANWGPVGNIAGGGVPTKDLGLPDEYAFDGWGRRIAYHVDTRATVAATFATAGALTVNDDAGTARTASGVYALVSAGKNGHGGYTRGGTPFNAGSTNTSELANCGSGAAPCAPAYDATFVQKMEQADSTTATDKFDDIVVYKLLGHITGGGSSDTLWTQTGANISNTNAGNVGIGTSAPGNKLSVGVTAGQSNALIAARMSSSEQNSYEWGHSNPAGYGSTLGAWSGGGQPFICLSCEGGTAANTFRTRGLKGSAIWSDNAGGLRFSRAATASADNQAPTESMIIDAAGNVGIGEIAPGFKLDVNGAAPTNYIARFRNAGTHGVLSYANDYAIVGYTTNGVGGGAVLGHNTTTNAYAYLAQGPNGLLAKGGAPNGTGIYGEATGVAYGIFGKATDPGMGGVLGYTQDSTVFGILGHANAYSLYGNGVTLSSGGFTTSDARLKEDVHTIEKGDALSKVLQLHPVTFHWRKDAEQYAGERGVQIGLIAQEAQKVIPNLVREVETPKIPEMDLPTAPPAPAPDGKGGLAAAAPVAPTPPVPKRHESLNQKLGTTLAVEYTDVVPYLIGAVQELNGKIEQVAGRRPFGKKFEPLAPAVPIAFPAAAPVVETTAVEKGLTMPAQNKLPRWLLAALIAPWFGIAVLAWNFRRRR